MRFQWRFDDHRVGWLTVLAVFATLAASEASAQTGSNNADATSAAASDPTPASAGGWLSEPDVISAPIKLFDRFKGNRGGTSESGFYVELSNSATGAGWVSAGPGYRRWVGVDDRLLLEGSASLSWHLYKMVQGRVEMPKLLDGRVTAGTQAMWQDQTQVDYYGHGPDSAEANRSQYRMRTTDVAGYGTWRLTGSLSVNGEFGWLSGLSLAAAGGTFGRDFPDARELFADQPASTEAFQPNFLHGEVDVTLDSRDHKGHPTRGGLIRAALITYRDVGADRLGYDGVEIGAARFVPLLQDRWVLAVRGWADLGGAPPGHEVPFYMQPSLGGSSSLRGYHTYRFHDLNTLIASVESRWALFEHLDVAAFVDAGNVGARPRDLNLAKTSYGGGVRLHTIRNTVARVDVAYGAEGWRFLARTNDPFRLSRLTRRTARLPVSP